MTRILGDETIEHAVLGTMRGRGGSWAAYQNHDLSHSERGRLAFLQYGPGCTFEAPPVRYPDTPEVGLGWRYLLVGTVNLESGRIEPLPVQP